MKTLFRVSLLLLVMALLAAACGDDDAATTTAATTTSAAGSSTTGGATTTAGSTTTVTEPPIAGGILRVAQGVDPRTMTPWTSVAAELSVTQAIFERLIAYNLKTGEYDARLAESFEFIDPLTVEFKLRQDVTFTNGEPFNADAAVFSFEKIMDPEVGSLELGDRTSNMESVEKIDDYTIRLHYSEPAIAQSLNLAKLSQTTYMVPPGYFEEAGYDGFIEDPVGSGPFMFESRVRDSTITLTRNPDYMGYSGPAPQFDTLEFVILPEPATRVAALESGDVDLVVDLPFDQIDRINASEGLAAVSQPGLRIYEMQVDTGAAGLSDITPILEIRLALMHAIDRQLIIDTLFNGQGEPINQLSTSSYFGFVDDLPALDYNPALVQDLLTQAGFPDGIEMQLECPSGRYLKDVEVCSVLAAELAKVGITVPTKVTEVGAYFDAVLAKAAGPAIYIGRLAPSLNVVDTFWSSRCESDDSYTCDPTLEALHDTAATMLDLDEQLAALEELVIYEYEHPDRIPLWVLNDCYGINQRVQGWAPRSDQVLEFWGVSLSS